MQNASDVMQFVKMQQNSSQFQDNVLHLRQIQMAIANDNHLKNMTAQVTSPLKGTQDRSPEIYYVKQIGERCF